jgi:HEAT repeat protein
MPEDPYRSIRKLLAGTRPEELREGLDLIKKEIAKAGSSESKPLFEILSTLFYIDPLDHPEFVPILDEAVSLAVGFGAWVIPVLVDNLIAGDLKAQWAIAHVLGRIGADSIGPMMAKYASAPDPRLRAFLLYAMGKIKSPKIVRVADVVIEAARSPDLELRDTATRTLGKLVESIPPADLPGQLKQQFLHCLYRNLPDTNASIRAKAIRSLGKMAKYNHLSDSERVQLKAACQSILGADEAHEWDRAFIVRREAEEALAYA